jgi:hypothetical protein
MITDMPYTRAHNIKNNLHNYKRCALCVILLGLALSGHVVSQLRWMLQLKVGLAEQLLSTIVPQKFHSECD